MKLSTLALASLCLLFTLTTIAQESYTQTLRGTVVDKESLTPLLGANVTITSTDPLLGSSTDMDGTFSISSVPIGRQDVEVSYLGYETQYLSGVVLKSGKELVLEIGLVQSFGVLDEITVNASSGVDKRDALNEFATVSARTFSVEETSRYAAAAYDPARMAQNYAGVAMGSTDDLSNQIVVRGNSPTGVLWRLEGIQIPNPNHFGELGNTGGGISMLSSSTLSNSDFYTGAFPAEIGNATSAAFDLKLRNGNNEKTEYAIMMGALGIEGAAEGPFKNGRRASYLINYRYATLGLLQQIGLSPTGDVLPTYSDLSFKLNFPTTKAGTFSLFGLGGSNLAEANPEPDISTWDFNDDDDPGEGFDQSVSTYNLGLSHRLLLDDKSYLHTVGLYSRENYDDFSFYLDTLQNFKRIDEFHDKSYQTTFRGSITYNRKVNNRNSLQVGAILSDQEFTFRSDSRVDSLDRFVTFYDNVGSGGLLQAFGQWKHRLSDKTTINSGLHFSKLSFNSQYSLEPRFSLQWQATLKSRLSISSGLHSRMENLAFYFFDGTSYDGRPVQEKSELGLPKAWHNVIGYDYFINDKMRLKAEVYYQHLYDIVTSSDPTSTFSMLNASEIWDYIGLSDAIESGTGTNVGIDLTLEKFFSRGHYYMLTGSLYDSKFKAPNGNTYNTRFNGNYMLNLVGGKEWSMKKKKRKERTFGVNSRLVIAGGRRQTPLDREASLRANKAVLDTQNIYSLQGATYARVDIGLNITTNRAKSSHSIRLDIQNITNRENVFAFDYSDVTLEKKVETQTGLFPFLNYRIEF